MSPTALPVSDVCSLDSALEVHRQIFSWVKQQDRASIGCVRVVVYDKSMEPVLSAETLRSEHGRGWWDFEAVASGAATFGGIKI